MAEPTASKWLVSRFEIQLKILVRPKFIVVGRPDPVEVVDSWLGGTGKVVNNNAAALNEMIHQCRGAPLMQSVFDYLPAYEIALRLSRSTRNCVQNVQMVDPGRPIPIPKFQSLLRRRTCRNN